MAATLVQEKLLASVSLSTLASVSFDSPVSSGNSVIVVFTQTGGITSTSANVITASDTGNGSYGTRVNDIEGGGNKRNVIFAKHSLSSGGFSAVSLQASTTISGQASLFEVSGLNSSVVSGFRAQVTSSAIAGSTAALTETGFAVGAINTGGGLTLNTLEAGYTASTAGFTAHIRGSSASHSFSNTQCTGTIAGNTSNIGILAIFSDVASAAVGLRPILRPFFGVGR